MFNFTSGPGTIVDPTHIEHMAQPPGFIDGVKTIQLSEDHRLFLQGQFGNFRIYFLVNHSRFEVIPESVKRISDDKFSASIKAELSLGDITTHDIEFSPPIKPFHQVRAHSYGLVPDSFEFNVPGYNNECFPCDLTFLLKFGINPPKIPLKIAYIGIAKAEGREAQDRLGEGHDKLQKILAEQNRRQSRQTTSIILYRPSDFKIPVIPFSDVIEIIEGSMIQHFKPKPLNIQRLNFPMDSPKYLKMLKYMNVTKIITNISAPEGTELYSDVTPKSSEHDIELIIY